MSSAHVVVVLLSAWKKSRLPSTQYCTLSKHNHVFSRGSSWSPDGPHSYTECVSSDIASAATFSIRAVARNSTAIGLPWLTHAGRQLIAFHKKIQIEILLIEQRR